MNVNYCSANTNINDEAKVITRVSLTQDDSQNVEPLKIHHIQILDRSGSMSMYIEDLIEDCKKTITMMNPGDLYTIIWFSGAGQFRTILKGIPVGDNEVMNDSFKVLDEIKSTVGCTCFSEPIKESSDIIDELSIICPNFSITLFTDGEPVCPWSEDEENNRIITLIDKMKDKIISFNTIGYGNFCNEKMLQYFSSITDFGQFVHSSKIDEYSTIFHNNYENISDVIRTKIKFSINNQMRDCDVYYSSGSFISKMYSNHPIDMIYEINNSRKKNVIYIVSDCELDLSIIEGSESEKFTRSALSESHIPGILYKIAYCEYMIGNREKSLNITKHLCDRNLIDDHINSFTPDEIGNHVKKLKNSAFSKTCRNPDSCNSNYIPSETCPCVLDILEIISSNDGNFYVPSENYNRIGKKTDDEFNMFNKSEDSSRICDIVFNEEKLNISIRFETDGYVTLNPKQASKVGLPSKLPSRIYRTHTIVKDGFLNMDSLTVSITDLTMSSLISFFIAEYGDLGMSKFKEILKGEVVSNKSNSLNTIVIDLTKIPIINKAFDNLTINDVADLVILKTKYKSIIKVLNKVMKGKNIDNQIHSVSGNVYNDEQAELLKEYGIDKFGTYSGISNKTPKNNDCSDFYFSRTLKFDLKGFSSLSPINDDLTINGSKTGDFFMKEYIENVCNPDSVNYTLIKQYKELLNACTIKLCGSKIAKILTGSWYEGIVPDAKKTGYYNYAYPDHEIDGKPVILIVRATKDKVYL